MSCRNKEDVTVSIRYVVSVSVIVSVNDRLVNLFLEKKIKYNQIASIMLKLINYKVFLKYKKLTPKKIEDINKAKIIILQLINKRSFNHTFKNRFNYIDNIKEDKFKDQHNKELWPELKNIMSSKIKSRSRSEWIEIFKDSDACVSPVLSMEEAKKHPHNIERDAFINIDGFNQPNASPRYSVTKQEIKHNAKQVGADLDDICKEFNLSIDALKKT